MRRATMFLAAFALTQTPLAAIAADHSGDSHWIRSWDSHCWLYNPTPQNGVSVSWEGVCDAGGEATGEGKTTWFLFNQWQVVETGEMLAGRMNGWWEHRLVGGEVGDAYWVNGVRRDVPASVQASGNQPAPPAAREPTLLDRAVETQRRQSRENCERQAMGANIGGCTPP